MKIEPLFAHLLKLFRDIDRVKKENGKKQFSVKENEHDRNDQKNLAENQTTS